MRSGLGEALGSAARRSRLGLLLVAALASALSRYEHAVEGRSANRLSTVREYRDIGHVRPAHDSQPTMYSTQSRQ